MLNVQNAKTTITATVKQTNLGNVEYTMAVVDVTGVQVVHTVRSEALNKQYQWITETLDLINYEEAVREKIAEVFPNNREEVDEIPEEKSRVVW